MGRRRKEIILTNPSSFLNDESIKSSGVDFGTGIPSSSKKILSVYFRNNLECKDSTKFEPGSKLKTFFGFDIKYSSKYTLLINSWGTSGNILKLILTKLQIYEKITIF